MKKAILIFTLILILPSVSYSLTLLEVEKFCLTHKNNENAKEFISKANRALIMFPDITDRMVTEGTTGQYGKNKDIEAFIIDLWMYFEAVKSSPLDDRNIKKTWTAFFCPCGERVSLPTELKRDYPEFSLAFKCVDKLLIDGKKMSPVEKELYAYAILQDPQRELMIKASLEKDLPPPPKETWKDMQFSEMLFPELTKAIIKYDENMALTIKDKRQLIKSLPYKKKKSIKILREKFLGTTEIVPVQANLEKEYYKDKDLIKSIFFDPESRETLKNPMGMRLFFSSYLGQGKEAQKEVNELLNLK